METTDEDPAPTEALVAEGTTPSSQSSPDLSDATQPPFGGRPDPPPRAPGRPFQPAREPTLRPSPGLMLAAIALVVLMVLRGRERRRKAER